MDEEDKKSLEEIHDYWKNDSIPEHYLRHRGRSEFLFSHISKYIDESKQVLEIGCNLGRNLNYLYEKNYRNLTGIEISEQAINQLKKYHPHLIDEGEVIHSSVENIIEELPTNQYDLVFTMAVLEHIHPDSEVGF